MSLRPDVVDRLADAMLRILTQGAQSENASVDEIMSAALTAAQRMSIGTVESPMLDAEHRERFRQHISTALQTMLVKFADPHHVH